MLLIKQNYLVEFIFWIMLLNELNGKCVGLPKLFKNNNYRRLGSNSLTHGMKMSRNYLYLNYKEIYGIRFEPNNIRRPFKNHSVAIETNFDENPGPDVSNDVPNWNDNPSVGVDEHDQSMINNSDTGNSDPNNGNKDTATGNMDSNVDSIMMSSMMTPIKDNDEMDTISTGVMTNAMTTTSTSIMSSETPSTNSLDNNNDRKIHSFTALVKRLNPITITSIPTYNNNRPTSSSPIKNTLNLIKKRIKQWLTWDNDYNASLVNGQRFLNIFNVIKFENGPCSSTQQGLAGMSGICYQDFQCSELGGIPIDSCADGLGVCCIFKSECGQTTNQMISYFQNPGWPEANRDRIICTLTVDMQSDVVQILLDFVTFEMRAPINGNCTDDQFFVAGQNLNNQIPTICGINSGQHMYIEVDHSMERKLFLSILTNGLASRAFNIRVTQLTSPVAPNNCLQFYTDLEGWFQTFNYDDTSLFITERNPSYFNNLNYVICIQRQWDHCTVTYGNEVNNVEYNFQMVNVDSDGTSVIPEKQAGIEIFNCADDYIAVNSIRICGEKLNDASRIDDLGSNDIVIDRTNGLNIIPVRTNDMTVGRGFRINYKQIPCVEQSATYDSVEESTEIETETEMMSYG